MCKLHFEGQDRDSVFRKKEQGGGKLLFLIRDPRDSVASNIHGPHLPAQPFAETPSGKAYIRDYVLICGIIDEFSPLLVYYEDLCQNPDNVQQRIAEYFNLEIEHPFSKGYERYRTIAQDEHVAAMRGGYNKDPLRPIDTTSIGVWKNNPNRNYIEEFARLPEVALFIERFYN